jgi:uncharacterized membrane protein
MDNVLTIALRLLHVAGGIFWAGSLFTTVRFLQPTARAQGPSGGQFMGRLMTEGRLSQAMAGAAVVTVLSGGFLFSRDFGAGSAMSGPMLGFTIGAVAGTVAWVLGLVTLAPIPRKMGRLGERAGKGEDVGAEMGALAAAQERWTQVVAWLVLVAVLAMSTARYW